MTVVRTPDSYPCDIRVAVAADIAALLVLYHELHEAHRSHHPELFSPKLTRDTSELTRSIDNVRVGFFVAEFASDAGPKVGALLRVVDTHTPDGVALQPRRFGLVDELVGPG
jgi:hypothetical protein